MDNPTCWTVSCTCNVQSIIFFLGTSIFSQPNTHYGNKQNDFVLSFIQHGHESHNQYIHNVPEQMYLEQILLYLISG